MKNRIEKLQTLDENKLIDVVKNYRQYGYDEDIRNAAIEILETRGIDIESLKLRGDFINESYDDAKTHYKAFEKFSLIAFILYGIMILIRITIPLIEKTAEPFQYSVVTIFWFSLIGYILFLIKSFISQTNYYKLIGKKESQLNPVMFFTIGMLLYVVMFFAFRKQMKADINLIR